MKDYLEANGVEAKFPREVIKMSFHYEIIEDGEIWMDMLEKRNLLAHTYDEIKKIKEDYFDAISKVYGFLRDKK